MPREKGSATKAANEKNLLTTTSLNQLQSDDCRQIFSAVGELRSCGLDSYIALPNYVVVGDQSAGKSSVLRRITGVPFPDGERMCTRFATEIVLRNGPSDSVKIRIIPGQHTTAIDRASLEKFNKKFTDLADIPDLIKAATKHMGLHKAKADAFSQHRLSIELEGPEKANMSLVDLPGLIRTETDEQSAEDMSFIRTLVIEYLQSPRTTMLAVISAKADISSHEIMTLCKKHDPNGDRTLVVPTKLDTLEPSSRDAEAYLRLIENKPGSRTYVKLGIIPVVNSSDADETSFFNKGMWKNLHSSRKGIKALRTRVSDVQSTRLKNELPKIHKETMDSLEETLQELKLLGEPRADIREQRRLLRILSGHIQGIINGAANGQYEDKSSRFFPKAGRHSAADKHKFLRAKAHDLQDQFVRQMYHHGHKYEIASDSGTSGTSLIKDGQKPPSAPYNKPTPIKRPRVEATAWVKKLHSDTRGMGVPGTFSPLLVSHLFQEQSENWDSIAREHIKRVDEAVGELVNSAIRHLAPEDLANNILTYIDSKLGERFENAQVELDKLERDRQEHATIHDAAYASEVQEIHDKYFKDAVQRAMEGQHVVLKESEKDSDTIAAKQALNHHLVLYKSKCKTWNNNVTQQVIERHLLADLAEEILTPEIIEDMDDAEISRLAAEPRETSQRREDLQRP